MKKQKLSILLALFFQVFTISGDSSIHKMLQKSIQNEMLEPSKLHEYFDLFDVQYTTVTALITLIATQRSVLAEMFEKDSDPFQKQCDILFKKLGAQTPANLSSIYKCMPSKDIGDGIWYPQFDSLDTFDKYEGCVLFILGRYQKFILNRDHALRFIEKLFTSETNLVLELSKTKESLYLIKRKEDLNPIREKDKDLFMRIRALFQLYRPNQLCNPRYKRYINSLLQDPYVKQFLDQTGRMQCGILCQNNNNRSILGFLDELEQFYDFELEQVEHDILCMRRSPYTTDPVTGQNEHNTSSLSEQVLALRQEVANLTKQISDLQSYIQSGTVKTG